MSEVTHLLIHTVDVQRTTRTNQGHGRWLDVPTPLHTDMAFRISSLSAAEREVAEQLKTYATHAGYAEPDSNIARGDLILPSSFPWEGRTFRVVARIDPSKPHHVKVLLELIQQGA